MAETHVIMMQRCGKRFQRSGLMNSARIVHCRAGFGWTAGGSCPHGSVRAAAR
jgi:hypothetical protein